jgi:hypothetical protein
LIAYPRVNLFVNIAQLSFGVDSGDEKLPRRRCRFGSDPAPTIDRRSLPFSSD